MIYYFSLMSSKEKFFSFSRKTVHDTHDFLVKINGLSRFILAAQSPVYIDKIML